MVVRSKFRLTEVHNLEWSATAKRYVFTGVCDDGTPENQKFAKYTPNATLTMTVDNPAVHEVYKLGSCYYFDSTPA